MNRTPLFLTSKPPSRLALVRKIFKKGFALARVGRDGAVAIFDNDSPFTRAAAIAGLIARANAPPRARWFILNLRDQAQVKTPLPVLPMFGASAAPGCRDIAAPDFVFGGWREIGDLDFDSLCRAIAVAGESPPTTSKLGWYGAAWSHPNRERLIKIGREYPDRMEIVDVKAFPATAAGRPTGEGLGMAEQAAKFRYLIDVEGMGYSGRLKYLLHSGRPVLIQSRPWAEWYFPLLRPWTHFVPVARDFSDLLAAIDRLDGEPDLPRRIGQAGRDFAARWLTSQAAIDKWSGLLDGSDSDSPYRLAGSARS